MVDVDQEIAHENVAGAQDHDLVRVNAKGVGRKTGEVAAVNEGPYAQYAVGPCRTKSALVRLVFQLLAVALEVVTAKAAHPAKQNHLAPIEAEKEAR